MSLRREVRGVNRKHSGQGRGDGEGEVGRAGPDPDSALDRETRAMVGAGIREIGMEMEEGARL
jgi:hypothetical protein